ncbi:Bug family tripartite tricarboxylate transporter substrate binding protein [Fretibacterium sp. OH1220_COT-178]|uniref:Bug family tripartite tricarboxylate transporter substrate binding protein n=1 Tax=Fretibacterium sp. OH1220_COT-178 TaxID=2491047 RepID=UPI000F5E7CB0|nr:tripartite tricarboxylate transporter substrate binding protein [Fretibacterium sp. OH1220_COT-178]RRD64021.1 tripartite tricarboxylate transporter substrate binding protein [Fretibacterium sp. OH1220_COT-178]
MKRSLATAAAILFLMLQQVLPASAAYPDKNINGYIAWGAGGGTDNASRALTPLVEKLLGAKIILQNKPGAAGSLATTLVSNMPADGYSILYNAEGPALYKILGLGKFDYNDFETLCLMVFGVDVICVHPDTPYKTLDELVKAAQASPRTIKLASTGTGGIPFVIASILKAMHNVEFNLVGFDGDGSGIAALLGGHVDGMPISMMGAGTVDLIKTGKLRALAVIYDKRVEQLPDVPAITEIYPEFAQYLPIGHFYGAFVKKGTPEDIVTKLRDAYMTAVKDPSFMDFIQRLNGIPLALSGEEAGEFLRKNQSNVAWLLQDAGVTKASPEEFGIPKP